MCCLFGILDHQQKLTTKQKLRLLTDLSIAAEDRGTDATGIAYTTKKGMQIFKRPLPAHRIRFKVKSESPIIMGHTRMATQGKAKDNYNNHPWAGKTGNTIFALAHNGVLCNDRELMVKEKLPKTIVETDSYVAVQLLEKAGEINEKSLAKLAEKLEGSFTLSVLTEKNDLYLIRGDNPMTVYYFPKLGVYAYASTKEILEKGIQHCTWLGDHKNMPVACGEILKIDRNGKVSRSLFDITRLYRCRYLPYSCSLFNDVNTGDYIEDLKSIAFYYGYTPDMIDRLLARGFSPEEIEECMCGY